MDAMKRLGGLRVSPLDFRVGLRMLARYPGLTVVGTIAIAVLAAVENCTPLVVENCTRGALAERVGAPG